MWMSRATAALFFIVLLLSGAYQSDAQRVPPTTDVRVAENTFTHASLYNGGVLFYASYNNVTKLIRSYSVWNDTDSIVSARADFAAGRTLNFRVPAGERMSINVALWGHVMSLNAELSWEDLNVKSYHVGAVEPLRYRRNRGATFPLPTER